MMVRLVVFDMAGTVVNENNVVYKTLHQAVVNGGVNVTLDEVLADGAGKEKYKAIQDIVTRHAPAVNENTMHIMFTDFLGLLDKAYANLDVKPIDGAEMVFIALHKLGIKVVLNTGYNRATAELLIKKLNWQQGLQFDELVTASDVAGTRPKPDMIIHAMKLTGITDPTEVLKIGDSAVDIEEGKNASCGMTIGITTGAHTAAQLLAAQPDHIIHHLSELLPLITA